jgi:hypothetical protein
LTAVFGMGTGRTTAVLPPKYAAHDHHELKLASDRPE